MEVAKRLGVAALGAVGMIAVLNRVEDRKGQEDDVGPDLRSSHTHTPSNANYTLPANLQLRQVIVCFRHGDRPVGQTLRPVDFADAWASVLPMDERKRLCNELCPVVSDEPAERAPERTERPPLGQLTAVGVLECEEVGRVLRERYVDLCALLPPQLQPNAVSAIATNTLRTQHSAQNLLLGLYPAHTRTREHSEIAVHVRAEAKETLIPNHDGKCPRLVEAMGASALSYPGYDDLHARVAAMLGVAGNSSINWAQVIAYNAALWESRFHAKEAQVLAVGRLVHEVRGLIEAATSPHHDPNVPRLVVMTTHDNTMFPLRVALNVLNQGWPKYASNLVVEVARDKTTAEHFVRVLYDDQPHLGLPGCKGDQWCALDAFNKLLGELAVDEAEYRRRCAEVRGDVGGERSAQLVAEMAATLHGANK